MQTNQYIFSVNNIQTKTFKKHLRKKSDPIIKNEKILSGNVSSKIDQGRRFDDLKTHLNLIQLPSAQLVQLSVPMTNRIQRY